MTNENRYGIVVLSGREKSLKGWYRMDWMTEMVKSYKELLDIGMEVFGNKDKAIEYANANSCAGKEVKRIALQDF